MKILSDLTNRGKNPEKTENIKLNQVDRGRLTWI